MPVPDDACTLRVLRVPAGAGAAAPRARPGSSTREAGGGSTMSDLCRNAPRTCAREIRNGPSISLGRSIGGPATRTPDGCRTALAAARPPPRFKNSSGGGVRRGGSGTGIRCGGACTAGAATTGLRAVVGTLSPRAAAPPGGKCGKIRTAATMTAVERRDNPFTGIPRLNAEECPPPVCRACSYFLSTPVIRGMRGRMLIRRDSRTMPVSKNHGAVTYAPFVFDYRRDD